MSGCLLTALRQSGIQRLESSLRRAYLGQGATLSLSDPEPKYGHFLRSGAASASIHMNGGGAASVRLNGSGDLLEMYQLFGVSLPQSRICMLVPGEAVRVPFPLLKQAFLQNEHFRQMTLSALAIQSLETEQVSACSRLHQLEQRLTRYILSILDRCGDTTIPLTQEALSRELGVRRSSIALATGALRRQGLLALYRGRIQVVERTALEQAVCECYLIIRTLRGTAPLSAADLADQLPLPDRALPIDGSAMQSTSRAST